MTHRLRAGTVVALAVVATAIMLLAAAGPAFLDGRLSVGHTPTTAPMCPRPPLIASSCTKRSGRTSTRRSRSTKCGSSERVGSLATTHGPTSRRARSSTRLRVAVRSSSTGAPDTPGLGRRRCLPKSSWTRSDDDAARLAMDDEYRLSTDWERLLAELRDRVVR